MAAPAILAAVEALPVFGYGLPGFAEPSAITGFREIISIVACEALPSVNAFLHAVERVTGATHTSTSRVWEVSILAVSAFSIIWASEAI